LQCIYNIIKYNYYFLSVLSIGYSDNDNKGVVFILVFFIQWVGGLIITLNAQFLGSKM